ncbi:DUF4375 domain-containing protein [Sphingobacterium sp. UDSM-2020]|uniref:DMP19 family protein n=1 Tax=Sphingobacterium sp. UDSM-2020 TaxID=2795738 RepID=UPI001936E013|nr:DUF4375 domain-containing protein [Sphingobacterium sp. UDSM-2020]QQD13085.1 DUF4375 domain-containing protein [Sphingobacterium sp. UDSM-2020]
MDDKLIEQLNLWHEKSKHRQIIETLEQLPASELTYTLKNMLGRAYNNISDYGKALDILLSESTTGAEDPLWNFRVGYAYYYGKEYEKALPYFQKSAALGDSTAKNFEEWCVQELKNKMEQPPANDGADLDKKWFDFTSQFVDKLSNNENDWNALSEHEQELAALWKLEMDMYNGGFLQFFCNWGTACYSHAVRALMRLKATESLAIIQKQYEIIEHLEDNQEIEKLWDIPKYLTDAEQHEISEVLDLQYWDNKDQIIEKTFTVYADLMDNNEGNTERKSTLNQIAWSFSSEAYTDAALFDEEVMQYQKDIFGSAERWNPNEIVLEASAVQIQYEAWIMKPSDLLENERLISEDEDIFDGEADDEGYQVEIVAQFKAGNGQNFSALEFLMKAHNQQANKELGDHVFFEGIAEEPTEVDGVPTYYIACGS